MLRNRLDSDPAGNINENLFTAAQENERYESDTQKIVRRHLMDKNHVITDEEIASIRIGGAATESQE